MELRPSASVFIGIEAAARTSAAMATTMASHARRQVALQPSQRLLQQLYLIRL